MNKIDEIALRVAGETDKRYPWNMNYDAWILYFAHALLAELSTPSFEGRELTQQECYQAGYEQGKRDAVSGWISVDDRLPDPEVSVLVTREGKMLATKTCHDGKEWLLESIHYPVTHWMPLPAIAAAPKQEK